MRALVIAFLLLTGCGMTDRYTDRHCKEIGAKPGTDAYIQCRATLEAGIVAGGNR